MSLIKTFHNDKNQIIQEHSCEESMSMARESMDVSMVCDSVGASKTYEIQDQIEDLLALESKSSFNTTKGVIIEP